MQQNQNLPHSWGPTRKSETQQRSQFTLLLKLKPQHITSENVRRAGGSVKHHSYRQEMIVRNGKNVIDHRFAWMKFTQGELTFWAGKYISFVVYWNGSDQTVMKFVNDRPVILMEPKFIIKEDESIICTGFTPVYDGSPKPIQHGELTTAVQTH